MIPIVNPNAFIKPANLPLVALAIDAFQRKHQLTYLCDASLRCSSGCVLEGMSTGEVHCVDRPLGPHLTRWVNGKPGNGKSNNGMIAGG